MHFVLPAGLDKKIHNTVKKASNNLGRGEIYYNIYAEQDNRVPGDTFLAKINEGSKTVLKKEMTR